MTKTKRAVAASGAKEKSHPKAASLVSKDARVRRRSQPDVEFELVLRRVGYHPEVMARVAQVTLGNPTNMKSVIQDLRDQLETHF